MRSAKLSSPQKWILWGIPIIFLIGSLVHFLYDFSGKNTFVGLIVSVNESVWEHMKMVLLPVILYWIFYYIFAHRKYDIDINKWFTGGLVSLITALISIPFLYYFYTGAFGVKVVIVDILILLIAVALGQLIGLHFYKHSKGINFYFILAVFVILIIVFMILTIYPPHIPLFYDEKAGGYGITA